MRRAMCSLIGKTNPALAVRSRERVRLYSGDMRSEGRRVIKKSARRSVIAGAHSPTLNRSNTESDIDHERSTANIPSSDKTLRVYDGYSHDPLNDIGKEIVMADITAWIDARLPDRATSGAGD